MKWCASMPTPFLETRALEPLEPESTWIVGETPKPIRVGL